MPGWKGLCHDDARMMMHSKYDNSLAVIPSSPNIPSASVLFFSTWSTIVARAVILEELISERDFLRESGMRIAQGFLRPLTAEVEHEGTCITGLADTRFQAVEALPFLPSHRPASHSRRLITLTLSPTCFSDVR